MGKGPLLSAATLAATASAASQDRRKARNEAAGNVLKADAPTAYRQRLQDVAATSQAAASISPATLIILLILVAVVLWYFKDKLKQAWHFVTDPILTNFKLGGALREEGGGTRASFTPAQFKEMADAIENAFGGTWANDDEDMVYGTLRKLRTKADWVGLKAAFGSRKCKKLNCGRYHSLEAMMNCCMNKNELKTCRDILARIGVTSTSLG